MTKLYIIITGHLHDHDRDIAKVSRIFGCFIFAIILFFLLRFCLAVFRVHGSLRLFFDLRPKEPGFFPLNNPCTASSPTNPKANPTKHAQPLKGETCSGYSQTSL